MKALETNFISFINKEQQFIIPIYQRTYSWNLIQCKQLWNDILRVSTDDTVPAHFIGSVVYVAAGMYNIAGTNQALVIDGQQRLTTLSLLFLAMVNALKKSEEKYEVTKRQIMNSFLVNEYSKDDKRIKLSLTRHDKEVFRKLVDGEEISKDEEIERIYQNYLFFVTQIEKGNINLDDLFKGIRKLIIVDIALDREDNPQLIFESLNSTGLDLSQSDLIRNYVLMGLEPDHQKEIYTKYWLPMESLFIEGQNEEKFDYFMRGFLTIKTGSIPTLDSVYTTYKQYIFGREIEEVVADVHKFSKYYAKLEFNKEEDNQINEIINNIRTLKVEVAYPFLMSVYDDYENNIITKEDFIEVLKLVECYVFRRAICGIPTNSLNKTFANLYKEIEPENYIESLMANFILRESYHRLPKDSEFKEELAKKDVYNFRNSGYLFEKIEHHNNKERVNLDDLSVEHIMPQTLTPQWKEALGEDFQRIQSEYLHTIGNLTLTGYNSDMSNKSFTEKRDMQKGFKESSVRLNKDLIDLDTWNEETIKQRAETLSKEALQIWKAPVLSDEILEKYKKDLQPEKEADYNIEDYEYLQGDMFTLYELLKERIMLLNPEIREECMKLYIAFKTSTNFVDVVPQKTRLRLSLNMKFEELDDPKGMAKDVTDLGRWGNGDVEVSLSEPEEIDYAIFLIQQSLNKHSS
ncbi:DUF262 and DUF1524 domain-containing protein [Patescibacteria group bacterium]|nr:DUF262 and DUF1524 domain-containing protein [Patescibacteria group bacterium]MBU1672864.1 DUF262 and DUF1524 domain-containing protein [Patescibacteria group bacterium]MBU1901583.1 DUF262 and DUF1524 domain-containing protein [Patescibacteria group bacterium]